MLSAVGLTLIFGVMRIFNMAHGGFVLLGAYVLLQFAAWSHLDPFILAPLIFVLFFGVGAVIQKYPINRLLYRGESTGTFMVFIFTFGLVTFIERMIEQIWGYFPFAFSSTYTTPINILGLGVQSGELLGAVAAVVVTVVVGLILRTRTGLAIRALAQNDRLASSLGVKVERISVLVFALYAGLAALSGVFYVLWSVVSPSMSGDFTLTGFAVVLLGGMGDVRGALVASLLVGIVQSFVAYDVSAVLVTPVTFIMLIVVLVIKPTGIMGKITM